MRRSVVRVALAAAAVAAVAACSSGASTTSAGTGGTATMAATTGAQPDTAAAATAAARQYFGFYSARQFAATWGLLAPSAQRAIAEAIWVGVHQGCPAPGGISYHVKDATLEGNGKAVVMVSQTVASTSFGSVSEALTYAAGRWGFVPDDLSLYQHGSVKADIDAAKAEGYCAGS